MSLRHIRREKKKRRAESSARRVFFCGVLAFFAGKSFEPDRKRIKCKMKNLWKYVDLLDGGGNMIYFARL